MGSITVEELRRGSCYYSKRLNKGRFIRTSVSNEVSRNPQLTHWGCQSAGRFEVERSLSAANNSHKTKLGEQEPLY